MAQQTINIGSAPNDNTGDTIRDAGDKINDNFTELYAADAALGTAAPLDVDTDGTLAADSDTLIATQKAVKTYVDTEIAGVAGGSAIEVLDEGVSETATLVSLDFVGAGVSASDDGSGNVTVTLSGGGGGGGGIYDANWFDVTDPAYGATGDGSTDDTTAIQDAIDACEAAGGGVVYFPRGVYVVNGALQDTSRSNSQLLLPLRDYVDTEAVTIELRGECAPSAVASVIGSTPVQNNLSVIKGTLNTGTGALIGAHGPAGTFGDFSNVLVVMRDLTFEMPSNPTLTCLDLSRCAQIDVDSVLLHTGSFDVDGLSMQTTATSYGLRTPGNNNGALTRLGNVNVIGFYNGYEVAEHCVGQNVTAWGCKQAAVFVTSNHASCFTRIMAVHCQNGLVFTGTHATDIQQFDIEHASSGTWVTTYDVDDGSNNARGRCCWRTVLEGTGPEDSLLVNGANKFERTHLARRANTFSLTDAATVTIDCSLATSFRWTIGGNRTFANPTAPYDGQVINIRIAQDGTGNRVWTLGNKFKFPGGSPTLSTAASAKDFVSCQYDAADDNWYCSIIKAIA